MDARIPDTCDRAPPADVFAHTFLPPELRRQIAALWKESLAAIHGAALDGPADAPPGEHAVAEADVSQAIRNLVCEQHGLEWLHSASATAAQDLIGCLRHSPRVEVVLDVIGFSLVLLSARGHEAGAREAVSAVNALFRQHGVGCAFTFEDGGMLLRDDDRTRHNQLVLPALAVMAKQGDAGAGLCFQAAFADYDRGRWSDCMGNCCQALEAVLQARLAERQVDALPRNLSPGAILAFLADRQLPTTFEPPYALLCSLRVLRVAADAPGIAAARISPQQAASALHCTAAAILVLATASR